MNPNNRVGKGMIYNVIDTIIVKNILYEKPVFRGMIILNCI